LRPKKGGKGGKEEVQWLMSVIPATRIVVPGQPGKCEIPYEKQLKQKVLRVA
jgi:hypothetical protein